jgi:integrase
MSESVKHYLERLKPKTAQVTESILNQWLAYVKANSEKFRDFDPDQLIEFQRRNPMSYEILDVIQAWTRDISHLRRQTIKRYYNAVINLFAHNRTPLPPDPRFAVKNGEANVVGELELSEIRRVIEASNPMYRAFWTCVAQGLMGIGEAIYWSDNGLESLRAQLKAETFPIRIDLPGRKANEKPFYTFIGRDAIRELETYFKVRPNMNGSIFITRYRTPLTEATARRYWNDTMHRLAITPRVEAKTHGERSSLRHGKNVHEIRDSMRSRWRLSGADIACAEWFMGHATALDKYNYDKSPWISPELFRDQYLRAEPWLNILSEDPETVPRAQYQRQVAKVEDLATKYDQLLETFEEFKKELKKRGT